MAAGDLVLIEGNIRCIQCDWTMTMLTAMTYAEVCAVVEDHLYNGHRDI
jgi:hypothetical protein